MHNLNLMYGGDWCIYNLQWRILNQMCRDLWTTIKCKSKRQLLLHFKMAPENIPIELELELELELKLELESRLRLI